MANLKLNVKKRRVQDWAGILPICFSFSHGHVFVHDDIPWTPPMRHNTIPMPCYEGITHLHKFAHNNSCQMPPFAQATGER